MESSITLGAPLVNLIFVDVFLKKMYYSPMDNEQFFKPLNDKELMALARHGIKLKDALFTKDALSELARRWKKAVYRNR